MTSSNECPEKGGKFGVDYNTLDACDKCDNFDACGDEYHARKTAALKQEPAARPIKKRRRTAFPSDKHGKKTPVVDEPKKAIDSKQPFHIQYYPHVADEIGIIPALLLRYLIFREQFRFKKEKRDKCMNLYIPIKRKEIASKIKCHLEAVDRAIDILLKEKLITIDGKAHASTGRKYQVEERTTRRRFGNIFTK